MTLSFGKSSLLSGFLALSIVLLFVACSSGNSKKETKDSSKVAAPITPDSLTVVFYRGEKIFNNNCQQCHTITDEVVIGPGMKGIFERRSLEWVISWTKNSKKMIDEGDPYAVKLYEKYNKTTMQSFDMPEDKMQALMFYLANLKGKPYTTLDKLPKPKPTPNDSIAK